MLRIHTLQLIISTLLNWLIFSKVSIIRYEFIFLANGFAKRFFFSLFSHSLSSFHLYILIFRFIDAITSFSGT